MKFSAIALAAAAMSAGVNGFAVNNRAASFAVRNVSSLACMHCSDALFLTA